ncbi:MAG: Hsp20/alpha crystallin family protein [Isosphaeraceae bacterium]
MVPVARKNGGWLAEVAEEPIFRLRQDVDGLFNRVFGSDGGFLNPAAAAVPMAMWEEEDAYTIELDLPGYAEADIDVTVNNGLLHIKAERKAPEGRKYLFNGRTYGAFERVVKLPTSVKPDDVQANFRNGVLSIRLPKASEAKPRKISLS